MSGSIAGLAGAVLGTGNIGGTFGRFLRPASIRGVGFWIETGKEAIARRWVTHEFPGRDDPWHEDLGLSPNGLSVAGLLIGDDVNRQLDRLRRAAAGAGPARLVHPWYGTLQVVVLSCEVDLDANVRRVARFTLKLERFGKKPAPGVAANFFTRVLDAVDSVADAVAEVVAEFQQTFAMADAAISTVIGLASGIAGTLSRGVSGAGLLGLFGSTASGQALLSLGALLPDKAADLAGVTGLVDTAVQGVAGGGNAGLDLLVSLAGNPNLVPVSTDRSTPAAATLADVSALLAAATCITFGARAAQAATGAAWVSRDEALAARDRLADVLDAAAEAAAAQGWDGAWRSVVALRSAAIAEISDRAAPLPRIRQVQLPTTLPSVLLAYAVDGDALVTLFDRGADIAARNRARHPGFLPAARWVEVLT